MPLYGFYSHELASRPPEYNYTRQKMEPRTFNYSLPDGSYMTTTLVTKFKTEEDALNYFRNEYLVHNPDAVFKGLIPRGYKAFAGSQ